MVEFAYNARSGLIEVVNPVCNYLEGLGIPSPPAARIFLLAVAEQESGWLHRRQHANGPAAGLWQFEKWGGVAGVLGHAATRKLAMQVCDDQFVYPREDLVHEALKGNDMLACAFARLLMWSDPARVPDTIEPAWEFYLRTWRPGKPHRHRWPACWFHATMAHQETAGRMSVFASSRVS